MKLVVHAATLAGLAVAMAPPTPLEAREKLAPEVMSAAVRYALPHLLSGVRTSCTGTLAANGFLALKGEALQAKFALGAEPLWPQARAAIVTLGMPGGESQDAGKQLARLPDNALRPFVDGMLASVVASKIEPGQRVDVERALALIEPLPADNLAGLVGFIFEMVERGKTKGGSPPRRRAG